MHHFRLPKFLARILTYLQLAAPSTFSELLLAVFRATILMQPLSNIWPTKNKRSALDEREDFAGKTFYIFMIRDSLSEFDFKIK